MSLFNTMRTATSGMAAQSNALSTIGDNIANSGTTGYKSASAEFETALGVSSTGEYESGGVLTDVRNSVLKAGPIAASNSPTDLAINGNGFFVVSKGGQGEYLTRAGSFVADTSGNFVNTAGYQLMGYPLTASGTSSTLSVVNIPPSGVSAKLTTQATFDTNLPSTATAVTSGHLPADNQADSAYTLKSSALTVYDSLGKSTVVDVYMTKTADNTWQYAAFDQSKASATGGFPYSSGPLGSGTATFDPTTGALIGTTPATTPPGAFDITLANASTPTIPISLGKSTQLATDFTVNQSSADGYAASKLSSVSIAKDGTVTAIYGSGAQIPVYKIPLGTVTSPVNLTALTGNVYQANKDSGPITTNDADNGATGTILSGELENSNVDLATELTNMIVAQRAYEANSKVLQTGSDLLGELNRITVN